MAERRMFSKKITDNDNFMMLSASAQALYLHLCMSSDDDGFCNQVSLSMFKAHASLQDLESLLDKRYIYQFDSGVIVIKHWRIHNYIQNDRYKPTVYTEELKKLTVKNNSVYTMDTNCIQDVSALYPQVSLVKDNLVKDNLDYFNLDSDADQEETKKPHGTHDNVYLSENEYAALCEKYTKHIIDQVIDNISNHIKKNNGTGYGDKTYQTVIKWTKDHIKRNHIDMHRERIKIDKFKELERKAIEDLNQRAILEKVGD